MIALTLENFCQLTAAGEDMKASLKQFSIISAWTLGILYIKYILNVSNAHSHMCVCVCERERERQLKKEEEKEADEIERCFQNLLRLRQASAP